jgi:hypothetical protein
MAAMAESEELRDSIRLAERLGGQKDALVAPIHLAVLDPSEARLKLHERSALRVAGATRRADAKIA